MNFIIHARHAPTTALTDVAAICPADVPVFGLSVPLPAIILPERQLSRFVNALLHQNPPRMGLSCKLAPNVCHLHTKNSYIFSEQEAQPPNPTLVGEKTLSQSSHPSLDNLCSAVPPFLSAGDGNPDRRIDRQSATVQ